MSGFPEAAMKAQMAAPGAELAAIVGSDHLRPATPADAVDGIPAQMVIKPASADELARALRVANAAGLSVIPRGGGTKLGWGNPPRRADLILSTARLDGVLEHAWGDMTATRSEEHTSELQSLAYLVCRLLLEKKKTNTIA